MSNQSQQNNNLNKFEATVFLENFIDNLLANELTTYISPSKIKAQTSTEFLITKIVEIDQKQDKILSEIEEIKKNIKKE
jgi:hypothetical protein